MRHHFGKVTVWGEPLPNAVEQAQAIAEAAEHVALMADHHLGYSMPVGGVAAYDGMVSPSGVGYDIACGNKAVLLDADADIVRRDIAQIMDELWTAVSFGVGRKNEEVVDHELFYDDPAWSIPEIAPLKEMARGQLGTVGSGNHYVDVFVDERDRVWVGVHFGSRGLGHKTATHFLKAAGGQDGINAPATLIPASSDLGEQYIAAMKLAGRYAYAGRDWVCSKVASIIGAAIVDEVHNHHNFAWLEQHGTRDVWVVRKGATPAFPGQRGFVGATMAEPSVILEGVESEESRATLYSTVHGAGRVMSRTQAAGKKRWRKNPETGQRELVQVREGEITTEETQRRVREAGVELRGGGNDESPRAYKRLDEVLAAHEGTIRILHTLTPIGVAMAGANEYDPFKD